MAEENINPQDSQQNSPNPVKEKAGGWGAYEESRNITGMVKSEFDQKVYILDVPYERMDYTKLMTLVTKELDTSFINDLEQRTFYQIKFENVLEWANMGLPQLSNLRLAKLFAELKIEKSVGGFERILQGATLSGNIGVNLPARKSLFPISFLKKDDEGGGGGLPDFGEIAPRGRDMQNRRII